jgi:hypothetical protein
MLRRVALVWTDVSEEPSAFFIRVTRIGELGTTLGVTSNRRTLRRDIPEDAILHSYRSENLKSYVFVCSKNPDPPAELLLHTTKISELIMWSMTYSKWKSATTILKDSSPYMICLRTQARIWSVYLRTFTLINEILRYLAGRESGSAHLTSTSTRSMATGGHFIILHSMYTGQMSIVPRNKREVLKFTIYILSKNVLGRFYCSLPILYIYIQIYSVYVPVNKYTILVMNNKISPKRSSIKCKL